ncbi:MAG TPA: hypothetical protein VK735_32565 [Pseudonocardia sp.]|uniref:hypothetical protein n=1 Tax=Pseudonocardia sp. TaxID=60912 RepID=UPI002C72D003|nr:hypothetical protein [Pseudonocardia sp.]HTF52202.1 hypothetical protein [Pseudonocardia sp.]
MSPLCFIDTETDGVHPGRRPWEIAIIRRDENGERETSLFVEIDLRTADPFGLKIGGFYERHPYGRFLSGVDASYDPGDLSPVTAPVAAEWVARMTHGAHWVGAVPNFDTEPLDRLLREHGLAPAWHYHLIDVEALAIGYARAKGIKIQLPWKSDELMDAIGVQKPSEQERHTALGDARWCMRTYDAVMADE